MIKMSSSEATPISSLGRGTGSGSGDSNNGASVGLRPGEIPQDINQP